MTTPLEKTPYEEFRAYSNFSQNMTTDETISSQTVTATDVAGNDVTDTVTDQATVSNDGQRVSVLVRAGSESASPYKLRFQCVTSTGNKWGKTGRLWIKDEL